VGDLGTMVREKGIGWVTADQPEALAKTTMAAIMDTAGRQEKGKRARYIAETELAWPVVTAKLEQFYKKTIDG